MNVRRCLLGVCVSWLCVGSLGAAVEVSVAERVAELSHVERGLSLMIKGMRDGLSTEFGEQMPAEELARLEAAVDGAFSVGALKEGIVRELAKRLSDAEAKAALAWLTTEAGRKVAEAEVVAASGEEMEQAGAAMSAGGARLALIEQINANLRSVERAREMARMMQAMMIEAMGSAMGLPQEQLGAMKSQSDAMLTAMEPQMREQLAQAAFVNFRNLSDGELEEYVTFTGTEAGRGYAEAAYGAYMTALQPAFESLAKELAGVFARALGG